MLDKQSKSPKSGFTLMELLIVIVILGVLAGVALPVYSNMTAKAELAEPIAVMGSLYRSQMRYFQEYGALGTCGATASCTLDYNVYDLPAGSGQTFAFAYAFLLLGDGYAIQALSLSRASSQIQYVFNSVALGPDRNNTYFCTGDYEKVCPS
ncbi:MAG: prepilin-type N-terminal cleavage/methylation domain-containing protein [Candidatus Omnitrophota bacterium]|jgi:prepilin-type N-terminal cleavage/methylation domain-containing protein